MCADLYAVFIFELIAIAESSGSKIEIIHIVPGGAACPASRRTGYGPFPGTPSRKWGAAVIAGRVLITTKFSPQGAIVSPDIFSKRPANNPYPYQ